jgi:hypothetical protein
MAAAALRQGALGDADFYFERANDATATTTAAATAAAFATANATANATASGTATATANASGTATVTATAAASANASSSSSSTPSAESASSAAFEPAPLDLFARGILCLQLGRFDECREAWVAMGTEALEVGILSAVWAICQIICDAFFSFFLHLTCIAFDIHKITRFVDYPCASISVLPSPFSLCFSLLFLCLSIFSLSLTSTGRTVRHSRAAVGLDARARVAALSAVRTALHAVARRARCVRARSHAGAASGI